jgi:hypothetical protein
MMVRNRRLYLAALLVFSCQIGLSTIKPKKEWWLTEPYRLIQTNLREIDAIDFDIDVYVHSLKDIGANTVLINVGGIVANYYTDLEYHYRNPNLKFDMIREVTERLHLEDIRVIGRFDFSKLNERLAEKQPEWLYKNIPGEIVNYNGQVHTCVNGNYQQEYSLKILHEALSKFPLDGVFFNMIGYQTRDYSHNYHGICQSNACRNAFKNWSDGLDLPVEENSDDPVFRKYQEFKGETSDELFYKIHDLIKSFGDHIAICTYTYAGTDMYRKESNSHAALYDDFVPWEYQSAHNVKSAIGSWKDKQVSNAVVHFYGYPARHTADASWLSQQRLVQNMINGAGLDFYCIGRLDNLEDRAVLENVKNVFQFHKNHEQYLHHTNSGNQVLVLHDGQSQKEYYGIFEILTENHVLFDVMEHWCIEKDDVPRSIESYEVIILPGIERLSDESCSLLDQYVENGGRLLVTGFTSTEDAIGNPTNQIRLKSVGLGTEYEPFEKRQGTYFRIFEEDKERMRDPVLQDLDLVYGWEEGFLGSPKEGAESFFGFIPPAMIGPPEKCYYTEVTKRPGMVSNVYGKGITAFFTFKIGSLYHHKRHYGHSVLVMNALTRILKYEQKLHTDASPMVEITRQADRADRFEWIGLLNHTGQLGNAFHEPVPMRDIYFRFESAGKVKSAKCLQSGESLPVGETSDGQIEFNLRELGEYEIVLLEY